MPRECAFCPSSANITGEHLWSDWIGKALKATDITHRRKTQTDQVTTWHTRDVHEIANVVCRTCNGGWMSELENASKPILKDMIVSCKSVTLSPKEIATIAAVTFKNMVIADHMKNNRRPPFFTKQERWLFRRNLTLPKGLQMWFGAAADPGHGLFKSHTLERPLNSPHRFEINIFTYGVGHFFSQSTCFKWKRKSRQKYVLPLHLTQGPAWDEVFIPFWPSNPIPINWPARLHLAYEVVETFVHRWDHSNLS